MSYINQIISALMVLIPIGAVPRIIYCLCKILDDAEQEHTYITRIKNLLVFVIIAECALSFINMIRGYF
ncbi:MAG: hypothetical protein J6J18_06580 [Oscillospiraceae bacterium]|nr:hypothetical protein [Lachnospiraceae bacterium]MBP3673477.1 hypothetical protein [Oscillospiraceae bacterium]